MRPRGRQAQRPGECRLHAPPPHLLRDAGQLLSFGDYFKREAIAYAWELVTSPEWFNIPKDRLYVTIFEGDPANGVPRDDEAEQYWIEAGVAKERIHEYGLKDNFWQMGETGPCGPCSEIFYDMGIEAAETPGVDLPFGQDEARYVEIWNLVFMQFDRSAIVDPATKANQLHADPAAQALHRHRRWGWSVWPPCCKAKSPTSRRICLRR
jgi:hypothetical protein